MLASRRPNPLLFSSLQKWCKWLLPPDAVYCWSCRESPLRGMGRPSESRRERPLKGRERPTGCAKNLNFCTSPAEKFMLGSRIACIVARWTLILIFPHIFTRIGYTGWIADLCRGHRIGRPHATAFRYYPGLQRPSEDGTVREKTVNIPTADGQMGTFVVHPEESGPFAPVIIYMDVWGLRTELCDIARKVAVIGYYVLLPDLYYRQGRIRHEWRDANGRMISLPKLDSAR